MASNEYSLCLCNTEPLSGSCVSSPLYVCRIYLQPNYSTMHASFDIFPGTLLRAYTILPGPLFFKRVWVIGPSPWTFTSTGPPDPFHRSEWLDSLLFQLSHTLMEVLAWLLSLLYCTAIPFF